MQATPTTHAGSHGSHGGHPHGHRVPLMGLFMALLVLTAAEVVLFEIWTHWPFIPKFALVLLILVFTLPKALIVLIYFMHLKFEKQFIVALVIFPFLLVGVAVLPTLVDVLTLKGRGQTYNLVPELQHFSPMDGAGHGAAGHGEHADSGHAEPQPAPKPATNDPYGY